MNLLNLELERNGLGYLNAWIRLLICGLKCPLPTLKVWEVGLSPHLSDFPLGLQSEFSSCPVERGQTAWGEQCGRSLSAVSASMCMMDSSAINITELSPRSAVEPEPSDCCAIRVSKSEQSC